MEAIENIDQQPYQAIRKHIRSGDILLCSGSSIFSTLIQKATNSIWSHVGFVLRLPQIDRIMVLESVESIGVRTVPLSSYVRNYNGTAQPYPGKILLARHAAVREENITKLSRLATDYLGYPYRQEEIVHIATRISMHNMGIPDTAPDDSPLRAFICSEYAQLCFQSIGAQVDYNLMGFISPADFFNSEQVSPLHFIHLEQNVSVRPKIPTVMNWVRG